jgi:aryl-alcohol dehydrogenase-like predicted oxidoreductase
VQPVQIVYNLLRQRPSELLFRETLSRRVAILARLPLSSGMLSGRLGAATAFAEDDHRHFNRDGAAFDKGETFSGLEYATGLAAVDALRPGIPATQTLSQFARRWISMNDAATCTIPGSRRPAQVDENMRAADLPPLSADAMAAVADIDARFARDQVHHRW